MSGVLEGKVIIVTGASTGIGRAAALRCAEEGASIVAADINTTQGSETVESINGQGGRAIFVETDVSDSKQVRAMIKMAVDAYGQIDGALNNAGVEGDFTNILKMSEEAYDRTLAVDLKGVWLCVKYEIEQILSQGTGGSIVSTASIAGLVGTRGGSAYAAAKHGVVGLTKCAALEFARKKIRVNAVCPGAIMTPMMERLMDETGLDRKNFTAQEPMDRFGEPEEIAEAVVWLLSDQASFVTGVAMPVDGGYTAI
jgi:NAD(P)-dependent dehydrogenase (short-subunit alcohol dehydrogenase family)